MPTPSTRTPVRVARGTYSNLNSSLSDLQEGEVCYATDQNKLYVKEGSSLIEQPGLGSAQTFTAAQTFNANVNLGTASSLVFEGSSADDYETTFSIVDPTADRTIQFADVSGTVVTTGDTGTVTNGMLAGSIALTKLANLSSGQLIVGNSSNVPTGVALSGDATISNSGALTLANTAVTAGTYTAADITVDAQGRITSAASGAIATSEITDSAVTYAKIQDVSATDKILGRSTSGAGAVEEISCTSAGRALLDDADAAAQRTTLGLVIGTDVQAYDADTAKTDVAQTFTAQQTFGEIKEGVFTLGTSGSVAVDPANGSIQISVLTGTLTLTDSLESGQSVVLHLEAGSNTVQWPTITWTTSAGNSAPTLTAKDVVVFWKISSTLYGAYVGSYA